jgi:anaerobic magnesium-protoporphyrin IX monomethyl ester cyclase
MNLFFWKRKPIVIYFLEVNNQYDLRYDVSVAYRQIKAYLLKYSKYANNIKMEFVNGLEDVTQDAAIIGVSSTSQNFEEAVQLGAAIKERFPLALTVLGGHHISNLPETLPETYEVGVLFEGEKTFTEIVDAYVANGKSRDFLHKIRGTVYRDRQGKVVIAPEQDLIEPLDILPFPVFEGSAPPFIFSSRGCPYKCSFCSSTKFWKKARFLSSNYVIAEIEEILKRKPDTDLIIFWDDLIVADRRRFTEIVNQLCNKDLNRRLQYNFSLRANLVDEDLCKQISRLRMHFTSFGAESGDDRILRILKGKSVNVAMNQRALDLLSLHSIPVMCGFVIGVPSESEEDLQRTFDFIFRNVETRKMADAVVNLLMPLPGTEMWEHAIQNGIVKQPVDWRRMRVFANYRYSNFSSLAEWIDARLSNNTYYMNEDCIPHTRLLEMYRDYELKLESIKKSIAASAS